MQSDRVLVGFDPIVDVVPASALAEVERDRSIEQQAGEGLGDLEERVSRPAVDLDERQLAARDPHDEHERVVGVGLLRRDEGLALRRPVAQAAEPSHPDLRIVHGALRRHIRSVSLRRVGETSDPEP